MNSLTSSTTAAPASSSRQSQNLTLRARRSRNVPRSNSASSPTAQAKAIASLGWRTQREGCPKPRSQMSASAPPCSIRQAPRRPKGILRPLPMQPPVQQLPIFDFLQNLWRYREGMIYLSPAPLYHSAPHSAVTLTIRAGGTAIIMEHFDPERYLALVEKWGVTHSQLVPTMFPRMLKLPEETRHPHDLSPLE